MKSNAQKTAAILAKMEGKHAELLATLEAARAELAESDASLGDDMLVANDVAKVWKRYASLGDDVAMLESAVKKSALEVAKARDVYDAARLHDALDAFDAAGREYQARRKKIADMVEKSASAAQELDTLARDASILFNGTPTPPNAVVARLRGQMNEAHGLKGQLEALAYQMRGR